MHFNWIVTLCGEKHRALGGGPGYKRWRPSMCQPWTKLSPNNKVQERRRYESDHVELETADRYDVMQLTSGDMY